MISRPNLCTHVHQMCISEPEVTEAFGGSCFREFPDSSGTKDEDRISVMLCIG